jgi:hypothetical protein
MATTVEQLIDYLSHEDPDSPVFYQYLLPEHTDYSEEEFQERIDSLNDYVYDNLSRHMTQILDEVDTSTPEEEN